MIGVWLASTPGASSAAGSSEVWLSGVPPFVREKMFQESDSDYMDLFKPDAPWSKAAQTAQWTQVYRKVVGEPLSFFHSDVAWNGPWQQLRAVKSRVSAAGLKFGVIYDGGGAKEESDDVDLFFHR